MQHGCKALFRKSRYRECRRQRHANLLRKRERERRCVSVSLPLSLCVSLAWHPAVAVATSIEGREEGGREPGAMEGRQLSGRHGKRHREEQSVMCVRVTRKSDMCKPEIDFDHLSHSLPRSAGDAGSKRKKDQTDGTRGGRQLDPTEGAERHTHIHVDTLRETEKGSERTREGREEKRQESLPAI